MSNNDCVSRERLLAKYDRQHEGPAGKARKLIENAPAVPQEMSAVEFMKVIEWLDYYDHEAYQRYAWRKMQHDYAGAVAIVEAWAKEHPERSEE